MRVLILEDEPLIAMDIEDIVLEVTHADCVWARTLTEGLERATEGVDLALLDFDLGGANSLGVAERLRAARTPFCFVSGSLTQLPGDFADAPCLSKPFARRDIQRMLERLVA